MENSKTRDKLIEMKRQLTPRDIFENELKANFTKKKADVKKFKGRAARLKGMITQWEPFKKQIENYTAKKVKESKNMPEKIARLKKVLKEECAHPIETLNVVEDYDCGDYLNRAKTDYFVECKLCGKREKVHTKDHSYYG